MGGVHNNKIINFCENFRPPDSAAAKLGRTMWTKPKEVQVYNRVLQLIDREWLLEHYTAHCALSFSLWSGFVISSKRGINFLSVFREWHKEDQSLSCIIYPRNCARYLYITVDLFHAGKWRETLYYIILLRERGGGERRLIPTWQVLCLIGVYIPFGYYIRSGHFADESMEMYTAYFVYVIYSIGHSAVENHYIFYEYTSAACECIELTHFHIIYIYAFFSTPLMRSL